MALIFHPLLSWVAPNVFKISVFKIYCVCQGLWPSQCRECVPANSNASWQIHVLAKMTRLGHKFLVKYQLKLFGQSQRGEKTIIGLISFSIKGTIPGTQGMCFLILLSNIFFCATLLFHNISNGIARKQ